MTGISNGNPVPQVQAFAHTHALELIVFPDIQTTDERVRQRREWYGEFELAVSVLAMNEEELLLVKKSDAEGGYWSLPGGFKEKGEEIEVAGIREAREETGYEVQLLRPLGLFQSGIASQNEGRMDYYLVLYAARPLVGSLEVKDKGEIAEACFVSPSEFERIVERGAFEITGAPIDPLVIGLIRDFVSRRRA